MASNDPNDPESYVRRESWRRMFADIIEGARRRSGYKISEAARLAGMKVPEWLSIETGSRRPDPAQIHFMAPILHMGPEQMGRIIAMCTEAWPDEATP